MTKKTILGQGAWYLVYGAGERTYIATTFAFDDANQLVSSTTDGVTTRYAYDAAGRMVREGSKRYTYGYLDKVMSVTDGDTTRTFTYHADGQLASATVGSALRGDSSAMVGAALRADRGRVGDAPLPETETFIWDGLALIQRGDEQFVNEPHVGGGNPVASSKGTSYFNDALGTTVGAKKDGKYSAAALTAFGENLSVDSPTPTQNSNFFTGKPYIEGLGHAFLMRNYRAGLAKWQTADPMGYPDGWNQLAYCGNRANVFVDKFGMWATGVSYAIVDNDVPWYVSSDRNQDNDMSLANKSDNYFAMSGEPLSKALVEYVQAQTGATATDFTVDSKYFPQIEADSGFAAVRTYVANKMSGVSPNKSVTFSKKTDHPATTLVSKDLNHAIHGVIFYLDGSIKADASGHWEGDLTVSFSDPYDFNASASDWKVRVWGRLYDHGWISKFNAIGAWTVHFAE